MKNFKQNIIFRLLLLLLLLIIFVCFSAYSYASAVSCNLSNNVLRLHILANSDSKEDQTLKLKIRDAILDYMNSLSINLNSKEEAINAINVNIDEFYSIAENIISSEGYSYPVDISIEKCDFPTKSYGDVSLPAGIYDALRIKIGSANGHNWWCVMFPPICFVDVSSGIVPESSKSTLKNNLGTEEYQLISNDSSNYTFKFKLIELVENIKFNLAQK